MTEQCHLTSHPQHRIPPGNLEYTTKWSFLNCTHFRLQKRHRGNIVHSFLDFSWFLLHLSTPHFHLASSTFKESASFQLSKGMCWLCRVFSKRDMVMPFSEIENGDDDTNLTISYWINVTCYSLGSNGVRGHWGHTHSCSVDPTHSEHVASALLQTCYLGNKQTRNNLLLVKGGELWFYFFCTSLNHQFGQIWQVE